MWVSFFWRLCWFYSACLISFTWVLLVLDFSVFLVQSDFLVSTNITANFRAKQFFKLLAAMISSARDFATLFLIRLSILSHFPFTRFFYSKFMLHASCFILFLFTESWKYLSSLLFVVFMTMCSAHFDSLCPFLVNFLFNIKVRATFIYILWTKKKFWETSCNLVLLMLLLKQSYLNSV